MPGKPASSRCTRSCQRQPCQSYTRMRLGPNPSILEGTPGPREENSWRNCCWRAHSKPKGRLVTQGCMQATLPCHNGCKHLCAETPPVGGVQTQPKPSLKKPTTSPTSWGKAMEEGRLSSTNAPIFSRHSLKARSRASAESSGAGFTRLGV